MTAPTPVVVTGRHLTRIDARKCFQGHPDTVGDCHLCMAQAFRTLVHGIKARLSRSHHSEPAQIGCPHHAPRTTLLLTPLTIHPISARPRYQPMLAAARCGVTNSTGPRRSRLHISEPNGNHAHWNSTLSGRFSMQILDPNSNGYQEAGRFLRSPLDSS